MTQINTLQSLDVILEDVSAEINLSINSLELYSQSAENDDSIKKCLQHLNKLKGVFTLLEMQAALRLITDSASLVEGLPTRSEGSQQQLLEVISTALARLMRYVEYVSEKPYDLPQLLLPSVNHLRAANNSPLLGESVFFNFDSNIIQKDEDSNTAITETAAHNSRHFRQMYQIGLIEVLRQTNVSGGLKMMQKSMVKLNDECKSLSCPDLWWIAQSLLEGFIEHNLNLTKVRLKLFSRIDRQIRKVESSAQTVVEDNQLEENLLVKEMLYLAWISNEKTPLIATILKHFNLETAPFTDQQLKQEAEALRGPSNEAMNSISAALLEEIESIESVLHTNKDRNHELTNLEDTLKQMTNLSNLLSILQVDDQIIRLNVAIDLLKTAIDAKTKLSEKDTNILFIVLEGIRNAFDNSEISQHQGNDASSRNKLSNQQLQDCESTHKSVTTLIYEFTNFNANDQKPSLLKNIVPLLKDIQTGFEKLKVSDAKAILDGCIDFVSNHLMNHPHSTNKKAVELFADIIGSLEFYLETLKSTAKPSPQILEFSENSLKALEKIEK